MSASGAGVRLSVTCPFHNHCTGADLCSVNVVFHQVEEKLLTTSKRTFAKVIRKDSNPYV